MGDAARDNAALLRLMREETDRSEAATAAQQAILAESREAAANLTTRVEEQASARPIFPRARR